MSSQRIAEVKGMTDVLVQHEAWCSWASVTPLLTLDILLDSALTAAYCTAYMHQSDSQLVKVCSTASPLTAHPYIHPLQSNICIPSAYFFSQ